MMAKALEMEGGEAQIGGVGDASNMNGTHALPAELGTYPPCVDPESLSPIAETRVAKRSCLCCSNSKNDKGKNTKDGLPSTEPGVTDSGDDKWTGKRKWQYFPGNNHFYCDGRIMTAPSIRYFSLSFALITITFGLFIVFDSPFLTQRLSIAIPIVSSVLFVLVVSNMLRTSCSDPGIIPRASAAEVEQMERSYGTTAATYRPPPRTKDVIVNGQVIKSKYCFTCRMFRPPRASHCSVCDNCVERFDHHCPFLGNCIGRRNYRSFYFFVVSLSLLAIYILSFSIAHLAMLAKERGDFLEALRDTPTSAVVILISFFGMWTVIGLAGFHTYLIAVEQTTNEDIKGLFGRPNSKNPYSRGSTCRNCCYILCGPFSTSLLDPRGHATAEYCEALQKPKAAQGPGTPGPLHQQPTRPPVSNVVAASYGLSQFPYTQPGPGSPGVDISHLASKDQQTLPSRQLMPTNPHVRTNGVIAQDQAKAGTFPENMTTRFSGIGVTEQPNGGLNRNQLNANPDAGKQSSSSITPSPNEVIVESMSMVHLQPRVKSGQRLSEDTKVATTSLRPSPSAASLERLTMINSPLHLDPIT